MPGIKKRLQRLELIIAGANSIPAICAILMSDDIYSFNGKLYREAELQQLAAQNNCKCLILDDV